jgi:hypothetical protein
MSGDRWTLTFYSPTEESGEEWVAKGSPLDPFVPVEVVPLAELVRYREALERLTDQVTRYLVEEYPDGHRHEADEPARLLSEENVKARSVLAEGVVVPVLGEGTG